MSLYPQLSVRWRSDRKELWDQLAKRLNQDPTALARQVLEEYLACFLSDGELLGIGLANLTGVRPGGLITHALRQAAIQRGGSLSEESAFGKFGRGHIGNEQKTDQEIELERELVAKGKARGEIKKKNAAR